ncbi:MAG: hypothetical protein WBM62_07795, partial [Crocosphaera sp.]
SNSYSPVDLMIAEVNKSWKENSLEARQTHQFEKLFKGIEVSKEDIKWVEEIRNRYNKLNSYAFRLKDEYKEAPGPRLTLNTKEGEELEIIHTLEATHPNVYNLKEANIYFRKNDNPFTHPELKYAAFAEVPGKKNKNGLPLYKRIGYVSKVSERNNNLIQFEPNKTISKSITGSVTVNPGVTPNQIKAAFSQVHKFVEKTYGEIPDEEKQRKAAALWEVTHRRQTKIRNEQGQLDNKQRFNKAVASFAIFGDEIQQQLDTLQFTSVKISGVNSAYSQTGVLPKNSIVPIVIKVEDNQQSPQFGKRTVYVRGKQENGEIVHARLGYLPEDEAQLPINCFAKATVTGDIQKVASATLENGQKINIEALKNYDYATTLFDDTNAELELTTTIPNGRKKSVPAVKLNGQLLGIIKKADRQILQQQKLTQGQKIKVQLNRGYYENSLTLNIEPDSVSYLPQHTTEKHILQGKEQMKQDIKTFWSTDNNKAKIIVNQSRQQEFQDYFDGKINYKILKDYEKAGRESELGLVVFEVDETEINKLNRNELEKVWGQPLSAFEYENKLTEIEEMPKQLPSELEEDSTTKSDSTTQTSSTSSDSPPWFEEDIPSIEDLENDYNTDFDPSQVPEPLDQYDDQDNNNSQTLDKNNIKPKPKPKTNNNAPSNNDKKTNIQTPSISIPGKPVAMNYKLLLHGEENILPVDTTIEAMRGHGRIHTTRAFEPYKAYNFQEGDLAIAYSGNKENPDKQVLFLVGEQYKITDEMIDNPTFRQEWSDKEKHSPQELYSLKKKYHKNNEEKLWGLNMTPLGDYREGKVYSFETGEDITEDVLNKNYQKIIEQQKKRLENQSQVSQISEDQAVKTIDNNSETLLDNENSKIQGENNQDEEVVKVSEISDDKIDKEPEKNTPKLKLKPQLTERKVKNETSQPTQLTVYCKGISEQKNGGWGYSIYEGDKALAENYGGQNNTSEIDMEFRAVLNSINKAIELNPKAEITIVTSQSVIDQLKQDSNSQNSLLSQINKIANGRPIRFNDEQKDNHPQRMAKVRSLAQKGLESLELSQKNPLNISGQNLNESKDKSNEQSVVETHSENNVKLNSEENSKPRFIPLNEIPSNPEFDIKRLMEQQKMMEQVAPVALEILKLQGDSPTQSYTGENHNINYDGHYLTITNKEGGVKMKAKFMGIDPNTQEQKWLSCLPTNSPGLTSDDVQAFTSDSLRESIIMAKIEQEKANMMVA